MPVYRVFVTRRYVVTDCFDVEATTPIEARMIATQAANKRTPDARAQATDDGWFPESNPLEVGEPGGRGPDPTLPMVEVSKGVWHGPEEGA